MHELEELRGRLKLATYNLKDMASEAVLTDAIDLAKRLDAKASGVDLALSYVEEMIRGRSR